MDQRDAAREALGVFALSLVLIGLIFLFFQGNLASWRGGLVGLVYLFLPIRLTDKKLSPARYAPLQRPENLRFLVWPLLLAFQVFPLYFWLAPMLKLAPVVGAFRLPESFVSLVLTQFLVVALPEELFFRGYLQERLDDAFPQKREILGEKLGWGWLLAALLFGLSHFVFTLQPARLLTFFPGLLFGWLRKKDFWAAVCFHAFCNLALEVARSSAA
jgi:membrane protease YdiL (CAAX protease family)